MIRRGNENHIDLAVQEDRRHRHIQRDHGIESLTGEEEVPLTLALGDGGIDYGRENPMATLHVPLVVVVTVYQLDRKAIIPRMTSRDRPPRLVPIRMTIHGAKAP